ncbi:MAG: L-2-amino-thiazoline-4-carboxylic acid hydrolase [Myxococcales bacterium]|nr:L-2-amino-thiazoline-4-carboxylic acid hydrolase [Myxococcales bacterium]
MDASAGVEEPAGGGSVGRALRRGERAAARAVLAGLRRELGVLGATRALLRVAADRLRGRPFAGLGPPRDERDRLSRRQCGDLVLLDRAVRALGDAAAAERVTRAAVLAGAVPFLDAMIPDVPVDRLRELAERLSSRFFNAEGETRIEGARAFVFEVRRCRFVELLAAVDAAHLTPLFCEADNAFFGGGHRPVTLRRETTIAGGAPTCRFEFTAREP